MTSRSHSNSDRDDSLLSQFLLNLAIRELPEHPDTERGWAQRQLDDSGSRDFFVGWSESGEPVCLTLEDICRHMLVLGSTGCGKTSRLLLPLAEHFMKLRDRDGTPVPVLFLDCKGEDYAKNGFLSAAIRHGRRPWVVSSTPGEHSSPINPFLQQGFEHYTPIALAQTEVNVLGLNFGAGYGTGHFSSASAAILQRALVHCSSRLRRYRDVYQVLLETDERSGLFPITRKEKDDSSHLLHQVELLSAFEPLEVTQDDLSYPGMIQLEHFLECGGALYAKLDAFESSLLTNQTTGSVLLYKLAQALSLWKRRHNDTPRQCFCIVDEVDVLMSRPFMTLMTKARSLGMALIIAAQSRSQLRNHNDDFRSIVQTNTEIKWDFDFKDPQEREEFSRFSGETIVEEAQYSYSHAESDSVSESVDSPTCYSHGTSYGAHLAIRSLRERLFPVSRLRQISADEDLSVLEVSGEPLVVRTPHYRTFDEFQLLDTAPPLPSTPHTVTIGANWKRCIVGPDHDEEQAVIAELSRREERKRRRASSARTV